MRTLIDITEQQIVELEEIAKTEKVSRAAVIRAAIDNHLSRHRHSDTDAAFGLWKGADVDGLVYQEQVRDEW